MARKEIVRVLFGSHLYGTNTENSDKDIKSIYIPSGEEILLQNVSKVIKEPGRQKVSGERNNKDDVDEESYSLDKFLKLLSEGQTVALDILFAPDEFFLITPDPLWRIIQENKGKMLTKQSLSFLGYCRQQSAKYGIKGSRVHAARTVNDILHHHLGVYGTTQKLGVIARYLEVLQMEHVGIVDITLASGDIVRHLEVCNKKMPYTSTIKEAAAITQRIVNEYGKRALQAEQNKNVDWKALSHAVRVGQEALELAETGHITFPLPNKDHILDIKLGRIDYKVVAEEIESLLLNIELELGNSSLPEFPDNQFIQSIILKTYKEQVEKFQI